MTVIETGSDILYEDKSLDGVGTDTVQAQRVINYPIVTLKHNMSRKLDKYAIFTHTDW